MEEQEEELVVLRRHSIFIIWPILISVLGLVIVGLIFFFVGASGIFSIIFFIWLITSGIFVFYHWYKWYLYRYTFTTKRIIVHEQQGLFKKVVAEIRYQDITEIIHQVSGIWGTFFNYGNLYLESGSKSPLVITDVYRPQQLQEEIFELRDRSYSDQGVSAQELMKIINKTANKKEKS